VSALAGAAVESALDRLLAEYATTYCSRPVRRVQVDGASRWLVDEDLMVELVHGASRREEVRVHEIGLLSTLRKELRSRRVSVTYVDKS